MQKRIDPKQISAVKIRSEIETRLALVRELFGQNRTDEAWLAKVKAAGYNLPSRAFYNVYVNVRPIADAHTGSEEWRYVEFSIAFPLLLRALFGAILSDASIFAGIPDIDILAPAYLQRGKCDWRAFRSLARRFSIEKYDRYISSLSSTGLADHSGRHNFAILLSLQADIFLMSHELGHSRMGHLTLIERRRGEGKALSKLLRHTFELEADHQAIAQMAQSFFASHPLSDLGAITPDGLSLRKMGQHSRWRIWTTMVGSVFLLLYLIEPPFQALLHRLHFVGDIGTPPHPPPLFRLKHAIEWARGSLNESSVDARAEYDDAVRAAFADLRIIARNLAIKKPFRYFHQDVTRYEDKMLAAREAVQKEMSEIFLELDAEETGRGHAGINDH